MPCQYDFSGNQDIVKFFKLAQEAGLHVILRIGPYVCAEWSYGYVPFLNARQLQVLKQTNDVWSLFIRGFPMWLHNIPGIELRTDNEIYKVSITWK